MTEHLLPNIFVVVYIIFQLFWQIPDFNGLHAGIKKALWPAVTYFGLHHFWIMYADFGKIGRYSRYINRVYRLSGKAEDVELRPSFDLNRRWCLGIQGVPEIFNSHLQFVARKFEQAGDPVVRVEFVRREWPALQPGPGLLGRYDIDADSPYADVVLCGRFVKGGKIVLPPKLVPPAPAKARA